VASVSMPVICVITHSVKSIIWTHISIPCLRNSTYWIMSIYLWSVH